MNDVEYWTIFFMGKELPVEEIIRYLESKKPLINIHKPKGKGIFFDYKPLYNRTFYDNPKDVKSDIVERLEVNNSKVAVIFNATYIHEYSQNDFKSRAERYSEIHNILPLCLFTNPNNKNIECSAASKCLYQEDWCFKCKLDPFDKTCEHSCLYRLFCKIIAGDTYRGGYTLPVGII